LPADLPPRQALFPIRRKGPGDAGARYFTAATSRKIHEPPKTAEPVLSGFRCFALWVSGGIPREPRGLPRPSKNGNRGGPAGRSILLAFPWDWFRINLGNCPCVFVPATSRRREAAPVGSYNTKGSRWLLHEAVGPGAYFQKGHRWHRGLAEFFPGRDSFRRAFFFDRHSGT